MNWLLKPVSLKKVEKKFSQVDRTHKIKIKKKSISIQKILKQRIENYKFQKIQESRDGI